MEINKHHYNDIMKISFSVVYIKNDTLIFILTTLISEGMLYNIASLETLIHRESRLLLEKFRLYIK